MVSITLLGLLAAALTTGCYIPQAIKAVRTRQTKDISLLMYVLVTAGIFLWLVYGIFLKDLPIILANSVTFVFAGTILAFKIKNG